MKYVLNPEVIVIIQRAINFIFRKIWWWWPYYILYLVALSVEIGVWMSKDFDALVLANIILIPVVVLFHTFIYTEL